MQQINNCVAVICFLVTLSISAAERELVVNEIADPIIHLFNNIVLQDGTNNVTVPDIKKYKTVSVFGKKFTFLAFETKRGKVGDLATLHRIGDVTLTQRKGLLLNVTFGLGKLAYTCDSYIFRIPLIPISGKVRIAFNKNAFRFQLMFFRDYNGRCKFDITKLTVQELSDVKVHITGFSIFNASVDKLIEWLIDTMKDSITGLIEKQLHAAVKNFIESTQICEYQPLLRNLKKNRNYL